MSEKGPHPLIFLHRYLYLYTRLGATVLSVKLYAMVVSVKIRLSKSPERPSSLHKS